MPVGQKPMFVQTKSGTKLLSGSLSFFQLGTDRQLYFVEIAQHVYVDPVPVNVVFPRDRIGAMADVRNARPVAFGWAPTPITIANMRQLPSPDSGTQTYIQRSNRTSASFGGPVYQETSSTYYTVRRPSLDAYQKEVWADRKKQLEELKSDLRAQKLLKAADELLGLASDVLDVASLLVPEARLGMIALEALHRAIKVLSLTTSTIQGTFGDEEAFNKLELGVLDLAFDLTKIAMPTWAKVASMVGGKGVELYRVRDEKTPPPQELRVPADDILDQIYRFRCIVDPEFPKAMAIIAKNLAKR